MNRVTDLLSPQLEEQEEKDKSNRAPSGRLSLYRRGGTGRLRLRGLPHTKFSRGPTKTMRRDLSLASWCAARGTLVTVPGRTQT